MPKRLIPRSHLTNRQLGQIIDFFVLEIPASKTAKTVGVNRHSVERVYHHLRTTIAIACEKESPLGGDVEVDESYFGGKRKGERGRQVVSKVPVFGLLKRSGKVYTRIVQDVSRSTLQKIIRTKVVPDSIIYSDSFSSYDGLVLDGFKHYRINHSHEFARGKHNHINGIENFWGYAKTRLRRYHGIPRKQFYLYLKEMEFRFNNRKEPNLGELLRRTLKLTKAKLD